MPLEDYTMSSPVRNADQQTLADCWDAHSRAEFVEHGLEATLATMTADPSVV